VELGRFGRFAFNAWNEWPAGIGVLALFQHHPPEVRYYVRHQRRLIAGEGPEQNARSQAVTVIRNERVSMSRAPIIF
jgi:hypothetical protein